MFNRICSLGTFLNNRKHAVDFSFREVGHKKGGDIPPYVDKDVDYYKPEELKAFFAACDEEERIRYMFFLRTGCREREVMFASWDDITFAEYDPKKEEDEQETSIYTVQAKPQMGFRTKNNKPRMIPIADDLVEALKTYKVFYPDRKTIFVNRDGGPEGHFLYKLKEIAFRAGLNCGNCVTGSYDDRGRIKPGTEKSCKDHAVCEQWTLHKFRRTWATNALEEGVPIHVAQEWIGHCDLTTLNRF